MIAGFVVLHISTSALPEYTTTVINLPSFWGTTVFRHAIYDKDRHQLTAHAPSSAMRKQHYVVHVMGNSTFSTRLPISVPGITCVVDEGHPHTSGSIGHFSRRLLPWYSVEQFENEPICHRFFFTRTPKVPLSPWFVYMQDLVTDGRPLAYPEDLHDKLTVFEELRLNYKTKWFKNPAEALAFKLKAWGRFGLLHAANRTCLYTRSNGRNPVNMAEVLSELQSTFGTVHHLSFDNGTAVRDQVSGFYSCKLMVSPHGSHNANVLFMQPGSAFLEMNPYKFFHGTYSQLGRVGGVKSVPCRNNIPVNRTKLLPWAQLNDVQCQGIKMCRIRSRHGKYIVNMSDFRKSISNWRKICDR